MTYFREEKMAKRYVYSFDEVDQVEARAGDWKGVIALLGGKGGNLAAIAKEGVPVPKGFTLTTEACVDYYSQSPPSFPPGMWEETLSALHKLEEITGKKFGDSEHPLLVSCRSGARVSMPGMMDTVLNLGLNDETCQAMISLTQNPRFVWDSYRRLLQGYGAIVLGIEEELFEHELKSYQESKGYKNDAEWQAEDWEKLAGTYKQIIESKTGSPFPSDPFEQIRGAIAAVFGSWNSTRAIEYRKNFGFPDNWGTACNIVSMVFGNMGDTSATGVAFTRNPSTGENKLWGDFLVNAQGEDVVAGVRTPEPIAMLEEKLPKAFEQFVAITKKLENRFKDMQDIEFTIENGVLWILQTRNGKRTATAAVKVACDLVNEGMITKEEALNRIGPNDVDQLLHPHFQDADLKAAADKKFTSGVKASPGAAVGQIFFDSEKCQEEAKKGLDVVMVRQFTKPDDFGGMCASKGLFTAEGGAASHAAVIARQFGIPAVVGCSDVKIDFDALTVTANGITLHEGDWVSLDGTTGQVFQGKIPMVKPNLEDQKDLSQILEWADEVRSAEGSRKSVNNGPSRGLKVCANADNPEDATKARNFGAEGIGLCRTEHMFLGDRAAIVQRMILAETDAERDASLKELEQLQVSDFAAIFEAMTDLPVIVRLLDPPLHEFMPDLLLLTEEVTVLKTKKELGQKIDEEELAKKEKILAKCEQLHETNPMVGFRGVRLCLCIPGLLRMQIRAITEGACIALEKGFHPHPEIMIPLTCHEHELARIKPQYEEITKSVLKEHNADIPIKFGTMIEVPRAAVIADRMAQYAEFFSFGTNDLTQMGLGFSRDDAEGGFLQQYREWGILDASPFQTIDQEGVGQLIEMAVSRGRKQRNDLTVGICGEHGGEPKSIGFCHKVGLDYVSCSPFRIPIARLAAAQACLAEKTQK